MLTDIPLYEKSLGVGITVVSARSGNKKVHNSNKSYSTQIVLFPEENDEGQDHCQQYYIDDHKCYMCSTVIDEGLNTQEDEREHFELLSFDTSQSPQGKCFIFYDFESMQEEEGEHIPNWSSDIIWKTYGVR